MSVEAFNAGLPEVICVAGPTASGKSALALKLARELGGEIVSADSMQVYRYMDVGTAKPSAAEREEIPHFMIDVADPSEEFSVVRYVEEAKAAIKDIASRGRLPIIAGGTGQYISALVDNISFDETGTDEALHAELSEYHKRYGSGALHALLKAEDPEAAEQIHENNVKRVLRAREMHRLTGMTLSQRNAGSRLKPVFARYRVIGIDMPREILYARINRRVDDMMESGLEAEAKALYELHSPGRTAAQAIGYKEFLPYFGGEAELGTAVDKIKQNTRNYAKRQFTWFRHCPWVHWISDPDSFSASDLESVPVSR